MIWAWLIFAGVLIVVEMLTLGFAAAFLAAGAVGAAAVAALGGDIVAQAVAFLAVSVVGILAVRPALVRYWQRHRDQTVASGAGAMIGETAVVVDEAEGADHRAHVRIAGENWPAISRDGNALHEGQEVVVVSLKGTALVVAPAKARR